MDGANNPGLPANHRSPPKRQAFVFGWEGRGGEPRFDKFVWNRFGQRAALAQPWRSGQADCKSVAMSRNSSFLPHDRPPCTATQAGLQ